MTLKSIIQSVLGDDDEDLVYLVATEIATNFDDFINSEELMTETLKKYLEFPEDEATAMCWQLHEAIVEHKEILKETLDNWDDMETSGSDDEELNVDLNACQMCQRSMPLTFHHLFPKKIHKRIQERTYKGHSESKGIPKDELRTCGIMICRPCHSALHRTFDHEHLAKHLNSLGAILADERMQSWISYAAKQKQYDRKHGVLGLKYKR